MLNKLTTVASFTAENQQALPPEMASLPCFLGWKKELDDKGKAIKKPIDHNGIPTDHRSTGIHMSLQEAAALSVASDEDRGVAISLAKDGTLVARDGNQLYLGSFDFDGFAEKDGRGLDAEAKPLLEQIDSYTELSDSTTGFKAFFLTDRTPIKATKAFFGDSKFAAQFPAVKKYSERAIEGFFKDRFLAITGTPLYSLHYLTLRFIPTAELNKIEAEIDRLAKASGGTGWRHKAISSAPRKSNRSMISNAQLTDASALVVLKHVNHHDEQTYTDVANAIWRLKGEGGRQLYHECMSGRLANDPYPDYDEGTVDGRYNRARDEKRECGYGWPHLIQLARQHPNWDKNAVLEWQSEECSPLTFTGEDEDSTAPIDPIGEVNESFAWDKKHMEIYDKRAGMYVKKDGFLTHYKNRTVTINEKPTTLGEAWLKHPNRAEINGLELAPDQGEITRSGALNIWRGYSCEPIAGDCSPFQEVFGHLIREPDQASFVLAWLARMIQYPAEQFKTALAIWGPMEGTGKNTVFEAVGELLAKDHFAVIGSAELASPFHDWQIHKIFVIGDEVCNESGDRALAGKMKRLVTASDNNINPKGKPQFKQPNLTKYVLLSNHPEIIYIEKTDRRYYVVEVTDERLPPELADRFYTWKKSGGLSHLLHFLVNYDCSAFDPTKPAPMTNAKHDVIEAGQSGLDQWVTDEMACEIARGRLLVRADSMANTYRIHTGLRPSTKAVANALLKAGAKKLSKQAKCKSGRPRLHSLTLHQHFAAMSESELGNFYDTQPPAGSPLTCDST